MTELNLGYIARPQFYDFHTRLERRFVHFAKFLPSSTMRIPSSVEYCLRVARRMSFTIRSEDILGVPDFWLISTP
jgi:hypothetical protein